MKTENMTRKTKEIHADSLMKVATNLFTAFFITILIVPMGSILGLAFRPNEINVDVFAMVDIFGSGLGVVFLILEAVILRMALFYKGEALKIYNKIYPDASDLTLRRRLNR